MELLIKGGVFMMLIFIASVVSMAIILERLIYLYRKGGKINSFIMKIKHLIGQGDSHEKIDEGFLLCDSISSPIAPIIRVILKNINRERDDIEKLAQAEAQKQIPQLEARLTALNTISSVSPLLGLLGTVTGMIKSFNVIAQGRVADAALAGGISEALLTTAFGLIVAIPCIIMYNYFARKVEEIVNDMEVYSLEIIDALSMKKN